jgi:catechol 2,3-dioxygenase-like lactoylglutathione lyase family enzyme
MRNSLHHVRAFASDVDVSVRFYTELFVVTPERPPAQLVGYF